MSTKGRVHSIETFGTVDGPGIRYILFMQGCPLRCKYCHNRDTWDTKGGKKYTTDEIILDIKKYLAYIKTSGGGLTVSGGEPTLQPEFLKELLMKAKDNDIHTTIDTSGFVDVNVIDPILNYTDLVLLDIKHMNKEKAKDLTGVGNDKTIELAKHLHNRNIPVWIRYVLVPGITDSQEDLEALGEFLSNLNNIKKVEVLPYHRLGIHKWESMNIDYPLLNTPEATKEDIEKANRILSKYRTL